jgi:hypothetical protein
MLPPGWITLITEQEATLARLLPHIFHDEIQADNLVWLAMTFDKEAKKPTRVRRVEEYRKDSTPSSSQGRPWRSPRR